MPDIGIALIFGALVLIASLISTELAVSIAIVEIVVGVVAGSVLGVEATPWLEFLAGLGAMVLTFLAGAEVNIDVLRTQFKESLIIGGFSFLVPFVGAGVFAYLVLGWTLQASLIAGIALSTTSLAVVYAVLVETGLTASRIGQLIMAACFVTDFGTALALNVLFAAFTWKTVVFVVASAVLIISGPWLTRKVFHRYAQRVVEPEIKFLLLALLIFILLGDFGGSHAVLPVFIFGLVLSKTLARNPAVQGRLRTVAFAILTPAFFIRAGVNVSLSDLSVAIIPLLGLLGVKLAGKFIGVYPFARRYVPADAPFTTLLMSTGLTFGTISSMYGLSAGIIDQGQFSVLVAVVILSAVLPTFVAQKWFHPAPDAMPSPAHRRNKTASSQV
jgi:Kef-type K+ transport system membrane component KefB